jgi:hypothetical protein
MEKIKLLILVLDLLGLFLISWFLFAVPKPIKFVFDSPYGVITNLKPVADAINNISRDFAVINRMRFGFTILVISQGLKFYEFFTAK